MFHLLTGVLMGIGFAYLYWRCLSPLRLPRALRLPLTALLFFACFKLQILRLLYPGTIIPEVPHAVLMVTGWLYAVAIFLVLCSLLLDGFLLLRGLARSRRPVARGAAPARPRLRVASLLMLSCTLASVGLWEAVRVPDVRRMELAVPDLPSDLSGLRIVLLTDLHISPLFREDWARAVVNRVNGLHPDLVLISGDLIDGSPEDRKLDVAPLADLKARYGIFACMGNHEYYSGMERWKQTLDALGVRVLLNSHAVLPIGTAKLVLGGVADGTGARRFGMEEPDVAKTFANSPQGWRLLLAHNPSLAPEAASQQVGLVLSGHTHGGQLFPISLIVARFNDGFLDGLYRVGAAALYVSRGVGLWGGFPIRLGAPSEITEITLRTP